jgi:hypothetical protein
MGEFLAVVENKRIVLPCKPAVNDLPTETSGAGDPFNLLVPERASSNLRAKKPRRKKRPPSPGLGFVKLDFLLGTKWGASARRQQNRPSPKPKAAPEANLTPSQSILCH